MQKDEHLRNGSMLLERKLKVHGRFSDFPPNDWKDTYLGREGVH